MDQDRRFVCQLCHVPFDIARIRTATEPVWAGWQSYGGGCIENDSEAQETCAPFAETGCLAYRWPGLDEDEEDEHIAGPACRNASGYSGGRISIAEMRGCRHIRALIRKDPESVARWQDEDDDQLWERGSRYFVSGISREGVDDEYGFVIGTFDKNRHGIINVSVSNTAMLIDDVSCAIPVHPYCWEIFKRVSQYKAGFVDVHGLWCFRAIEGSEQQDFERMPRNPAGRLCRDLRWLHTQGTEWLVANPVGIPGFPAMIRAPDLVYSRSKPSWLDLNSDVFQRPTQNPWQGELRSSEHAQDHKPEQIDPIAVLPPELRLKVLEFLPSKSVAAARLVFRSMRPLPQITFRRLLFEDLPWLWEAQDLPPVMTDWYRLYMIAKFEWPKLKGMKNRVRIWEEINETMRRVLNYRARGVISGITGWEDAAV